MPAPEASIIVPTYDRPRDLRMVLEGLRRQQGPSFEVIVADDGSGPETAHLVREAGRDLPYRVEHVWQEDRGFRLAAIRNRAIERARGAVLILLDGDCIPLPGFVRAHVEGRPAGRYLSGHRIRLDARASAAMTPGAIARGGLAAAAPARERAREAFERVRAAIHRARGRADRPKLVACNASVDRRDVLAINGFDERFVGWGGEDDDFARRLRRHGVRPASAIGRARVLHLHHPPDPTFRGRVRWGDNYAYLHRGYFLTRCRNGLVKRPMEDLDIRFIDAAGDRGEVRDRAPCEVEVIAVPGAGRMADRLRAEIIVLAIGRTPPDDPLVERADIALLLEPESAPRMARIFEHDRKVTAQVRPGPGETVRSAILRTLDPIV